MSSNCIAPCDPYQYGVVIENFPGYCVTPDGTLWVRLIRQNRRPALIGETWAEKKQTVGKEGYLQVGLCNGSGKAKIFFVHCLILTAFRGPCPPGMQACHDDGDPANNWLSNLYWGTPQQNWEDRKRHGRSGGIKGEKHKWAKLTAPAVYAIREALAAGTTKAELARRYNVTPMTIRGIETRRTWAHLV
jgi:hypothetical protein